VNLSLIFADRLERTERIKTTTMNGLDRYLTTPPFDAFDDWCEKVTDCFTDTFFEANEEWIMMSESCNAWLNKLQDRSPQEAATIIQIAFEIHKPTN
tara:strand:- start:781 stop:1071 length:291 start_codon:yes stop_codon:yes gene_type:complete